MGPKLSVDKDPSVTILQGGIRSNGHGDVRDASEPILAVGDSFTFGTQVSDRDTWPAQLEKLSGRRVINGGVFGYGIDQAFLRARRLLSRDRFSTVIFSFIPDDIRRCQMSVEFGGAKPYFDFKDGRLTLENVPVSPVSPHPPPPEGGLAAYCTGAQSACAFRHEEIVSEMVADGPDAVGNTSPG
jgi:hypothetical protein